MLPPTSSAIRMASASFLKSCHSHVSQPPSSLISRLFIHYLTLTNYTGGALVGMWSGYRIYKAAQEQSPAAYALIPVGVISGTVLGRLMGPFIPPVALMAYAAMTPEQREKTVNFYKNL